LSLRDLAFGGVENDAIDLYAAFHRVVVDCGPHVAGVAVLHAHHISEAKSV